MRTGRCCRSSRPLTTVSAHASRDRDRQTRHASSVHRAGRLVVGAIERSLMTSRADLHVHSRYSDRPTEWLLQRLGAPECYTNPRTVYDAARRRGMQFVTITDHNCIDGAIEIAHLPDTFVSSEITTYFPEDGCKVHV